MTVELFMQVYYVCMQVYYVCYTSNLCILEPKSSNQIIFLSITLRVEPRPFFARNRDYTLSLSQLLKVVETCFWAQNDRNMQVYIGTYTSAKL